MCCISVSLQHHNPLNSSTKMWMYRSWGARTTPNTFRTIAGIICRQRAHTWNKPLLHDCLLITTCLPQRISKHIYECVAVMTSTVVPRVGLINTCAGGSGTHPVGSLDEDLLSGLDRRYIGHLPFAKSHRNCNLALTVTGDVLLIFTLGRGSYS